MSSVITFVCACFVWSDLLSAVDLTLNLIRNMVFRQVVPQLRVCVQQPRDNSLNAHPAVSIAEIRNELFAR